MQITQPVSGGLPANCRQYYAQSQEHICAGRTDAAWACLEAAHILGQRNTRLHVQTHWRMLKLAFEIRDLREIVGQAVRLAAACIATRVWMPQGNSGRARVSAFTREPIPGDLMEKLSSTMAGSPSRADFCRETRHGAERQ